MTRTRYFIFNHESAFGECRLEGLHWNGGALATYGGAAVSRLITPVLDSGESGNVWQRVFADMTLDGGGQIIWKLFAADSRSEALEGGEAYIVQDTTDFLPIDLSGRYLRLEAEISGAAELRSLLIYPEWESFLDFLPEIYRDYNGFSDRFLRIFAAQYLELEKRIDELPGTFDPAVAPPDTLRWLAELAGVRHINLWETDGLRKLLTSGVFMRRGQFSVFENYVEYFTGHKPYIAENFRYRTGVPVNDRIYEGSDVTVFLPPEAAGLDSEALYAVIYDFLPQDVICRVVVLDRYPVISGGAFLGVNTQIGRYQQTVAGTARIGVTVIGGEI